MTSDWKWLPAVVVPNTADIVLVMFWSAEDEAALPHYEYHHILAWRIEVNDTDQRALTSPIIGLTLGAPADTDICCFEQRVGAHTYWRFIDDCTVLSFEEAHAHAHALLIERKADEKALKERNERIATTAREICRRYIAELGNGSFRRAELTKALTDGGINDKFASEWALRAQQKWERDRLAATQAPQ
jgi:hypothetical protein